MTDRDSLDRAIAKHQETIVLNWREVARLMLERPPNARERVEQIKEGLDYLSVELRTLLDLRDGLVSEN